MAESVNLYLVVEFEELDEKYLRGAFFEVRTLCFDDGAIQVRGESEEVVEDGVLYVKLSPMLDIFTFPPEAESGTEDCYSGSEDELAEIRSKIVGTTLTAAMVSADARAETVFKSAKIKDAYARLRMDGYDDAEMLSDGFNFEVNW